MNLQSQASACFPSGPETLQETGRLRSWKRCAAAGAIHHQLSYSRQFSKIRTAEENLQKSGRILALNVSDAWNNALKHIHLLHELRDKLSLTSEDLLQHVSRHSKRVALLTKMQKQMLVLKDSNNQQRNSQCLNGRNNGLKNKSSLRDQLGAERPNHFKRGSSACRDQYERHKSVHR